MLNATGSFRMPPNVQNEYCGNDGDDDENDDDCDGDGKRKEWSKVVDCWFEVYFASLELNR